MDLDRAAIVNVCESNYMRNVGDHWSAVGRNVGWVNELGTMISLPAARSLHRAGERSPLQGKLVIVGGSGLIGPGPFEDAIQSIFPQRPAAVVFWGIGHNVLYGVGRDPTTGWRNRLLMDGRTLLWPEYFSAARLVGVRDHGAGLPWVPCASCLIPLLDGLREAEPRHEFAVVNHYEHPIDTSAALARRLKFPHITNNTEDLPHVLRTIASARVVVSNSYHALYWALLLGRAAVVFEPFNTRFDHFKWPVERATAADWLDAVERARPSPNALAEARAANHAFSAQVLGLAKGLGLVGADLDPNPARAAESVFTAVDADVASVTPINVAS
jgi:hypothetical protein